MITVVKVVERLQYSPTVWKNRDPTCPSFIAKCSRHNPHNGFLLDRNRPEQDAYALYAHCYTPGV